MQPWKSSDSEKANEKGDSFRVSNFSPHRLVSWDTLTSLCFNTLECKNIVVDTPETKWQNKTIERHDSSVLDISPQELEFETTIFWYSTLYKWINATSIILAPTRCRCWCWGNSQGFLPFRRLKVLRNVFRIIWAPETWPSYSLCFPCFFSSPYFILFCIQNPYILQSYEKVGVLFTSSTSYFLWQTILFIFIT